MLDPLTLTPADLERMRREHVADAFGACAFCSAPLRHHDCDRVEHPCDAARLLAEFDRMWLAGLPLFADNNTTTTSLGVSYGLTLHERPEVQR